MLHYSANVSFSPDIAPNYNFCRIQELKYKLHLKNKNLKNKYTPIKLVFRFIMADLHNQKTNYILFRRVRSAIIGSMKKILPNSS